MERIGKRCLLLLGAILLACFIMHSPVQAAAKCKVTFANSNGVVANNAYKKLAKTVKKGTVIQLPKVGASGYRSYWVIKSSSGNKKYAMGASYKVTDNVKFCLYRFKLYTVRFYTNDGSSEYAAYSKQLVKGESVTLPAIKNTATRIGLGWSDKTNSKKASYKQKQKVKVTGNMNFYMVCQTIRTVKLYWGDGTVYNTLKLKAGETEDFPSVASQSGMILGWSAEKGKHTFPDYLAGESIPAYGSDFYMVEYRQEDEKILAANQLMSPSKYQHVYIIGDSRTKRASAFLEPYVQNVTFIAEGGMGLSWLRGDSSSPNLPGGYERLIEALNKNQTSTGRKSAIVFNLGGNDLYNGLGYAQYMNSIAASLKNFNCDLYYMSVNPVNEAMMRLYYEMIGNVYPKTETQVTSFNRILRNRLNYNYYKFIDTCSYLRMTGWRSVEHAGYFDGLHYSQATYQKIYNYMMTQIEKNY
ncbi:MAG: hypothetical protein Q4E89_03215 [Eubacteriales bacterium]|nr:hypothetical protein [Eubacteriales bacterium]